MSSTINIQDYEKQALGGLTDYEVSPPEVTHQVGITAVWLRPHTQQFRPMIENGKVQALIFQDQNLTAAGHWTRISCQAATSSLSNDAGLDKVAAAGYTRLRLQVSREDLEVVMGLALPYKFRFIMVVRLANGQHYLCPYQFGFTLITQLWLSTPNEQQTYRIDLIGYGTEGLTLISQAAMIGPQTYQPSQTLSVDWASDRIPLQMIKEANLANLE